MFVQLAARSPRAVAWHENAFVGNLLSSAASCSSLSVYSSLFSSGTKKVVFPFRVFAALIETLMLASIQKTEVLNVNVFGKMRFGL